MGVKGPENTLTFERNPYYFKVDTEGKQLPYIDKIMTVLVENAEAVTLKILTGEVDFMRETTALAKLPLYKENEEKAGFRVVLLDMHVDPTGLIINRTFNDENWRKVVRDPRFLQAVSMAINRQEILESIYYGFGTMPLKTVGEANSEYNPEKANALLNEMGLDKRDADGFRLGPDGNTFTILFEHGAHAPDIPLVAELVAEHLKDVGLKVLVKQIDPQLWTQRANANELQATMIWTDDQGWDDRWTRLALCQGGGSRLWCLWDETGGQQGEEPLEWAKRGLELNAQRWAAVSGSEEYNKIVEQELAWHRENLPIITMVENVKYAMIASRKLGNIPSSGYAIAANFSGEQFFFKQ